jgi:hypothetical protein
MIAAGVNAKALSISMGHASVMITLDRYGYLIPHPRLPPISVGRESQITPRRVDRAHARRAVTARGGGGEKLYDAKATYKCLYDPPEYRPEDFSYDPTFVVNTRWLASSRTHRDRRVFAIPATSRITASVRAGFSVFSPSDRLPLPLCDS